MAKRTECIVCYETKMITPCGANNDCNVYVCSRCKIDNDIAFGRCGYSDKDGFKCVVCKEPEDKYKLIWNLYDAFEDGCGFNTKMITDEQSYCLSEILLYNSVLQDAE